jgi:energy-converting hydrogenase Eha subunit F
METRRSTDIPLHSSIQKTCDASWAKIDDIGVPWRCPRQIVEITWSGYMALVKAVMAGGLALSISGAAAHAADQVYPAPIGQTQAAPTYPTAPYSYGRLPGPKASGDNWIPPSAPPQSASNPGGAYVPYQQRQRTGS